MVGTEDEVFEHGVEVGDGGDVGVFVGCGRGGVALGEGAGEAVDHEFGTAGGEQDGGDGGCDDGEETLAGGSGGTGEEYARGGDVDGGVEGGGGWGALAGKGADGFGEVSAGEVDVEGEEFGGLVLELCECFGEVIGFADVHANSAEAARHFGAAAGVGIGQDQSAPRQVADGLLDGTQLSCGKGHWGWHAGTDTMHMEVARCGRGDGYGEKLGGRGGVVRGGRRGKGLGARLRRCR